MATSIYHMVSILMAIREIVGWSKVVHSSGTFFNSHIGKPLFVLITEITGYIISFIWKGISRSTAETLFPRFEQLVSAGKTCSRVRCNNRGMWKLAVGRNQSKSWTQGSCLELPALLSWTASALALNCQRSCLELPALLPWTVYHWATTTTSPHNPLSYVEHRWLKPGTLGSISNKYQLFNFLYFCFITTKLVPLYSSHTDFFIICTQTHTQCQSITGRGED